MTFDNMIDQAWDDHAEHAHAPPKAQDEGDLEELPVDPDHPGMRPPDDRKQCVD